MAEAIIARGGYKSDPSQEIPVIPGYSTILVTVKDDDGVVASGFMVDCQDGDRSYNYTTNDKGQVLFVTNSGQVNITATNRANGATVNYGDLSAVGPQNVDAPIGSAHEVQIQLNSIDVSTLTEYVGNTSWTWYFYHDYIANGYVCGAGGGGCGSIGGSKYWTYPTGGGGGERNNFTNVQINHNQYYNTYVGRGGQSNYSQSNGQSGGTSSIFGYSGEGGGGGYVDWSDSDNAKTCGGIGAKNGRFGNGGGWNTGRNGEDSNDPTWGGGGGRSGSWDSSRGMGGDPGGGNAYKGSLSGSATYATNGTNGGGAGGGNASSRRPSYGSDGMYWVSLTRSDRS